LPFAMLGLVTGLFSLCRDESVTGPTNAE